MSSRLNVEDAVYHTAHDYPGGVPAVAVRLGISPNVLQNKVNPTVDTHKLAITEAAKLVALTGDRRIPDAFASLVGCVLIEAGDFSGISDMQLLDAYSQMMVALGEFSKEFNQTLQDGTITHKEIDRLKQDMYHLQQTGAELISRAEALVKDISSE